MLLLLFLLLKIELDISELVVYGIHITMIRTNIFLSKPQKAALEKLAKVKGISVAELIRRFIDKELEHADH